MANSQLRATYMTGNNRSSRLGILVTILLNNIVIELYVNEFAIPDAKKKVWVTTIDAYQKLPPPAIILTQNTFFAGNAVLVQDQDELEQLSQNLTSASLPNQRAFTNFESVPMPIGALNRVTFNGDYSYFGIIDDLFLEYMFWVNGTFPNNAFLSFSLFDSKFLTSQELLLLAGECGLLAAGYLFDAYSVSQISMEQINVIDAVNAINYTDECNRPEFRTYTTYNTVFSQFAAPVRPSDSQNPCAVDSIPSSPQDGPPPCIGAIDIKFDSLLVANQTSDYSKSRITMFTDEGGIIGAVMFVTWFFGIFNF